MITDLEPDEAEVVFTASVAIRFMVGNDKKDGGGGQARGQKEI
jgi:hypothetical protein